jgi:hypothetical protein
MLPLGWRNENTLLFLILTMNGLIGISYHYKFIFFVIILIIDLLQQGGKFSIFRNIICNMVIFFKQIKSLEILLCAFTQRILPAGSLEKILLIRLVDLAFADPEIMNFY